MRTYSQLQVCRDAVHSTGTRYRLRGLGHLERVVHVEQLDEEHPVAHAALAEVAVELRREARPPALQHLLQQAVAVNSVSSHLQL